jgi:hypothetical protein
MHTQETDIRISEAARISLAGLQAQGPPAHEARHGRSKILPVTRQC